MSGFDQGEIFVSDPFGSEDQQDDREINRLAARKKFKEFLREFHEGTFAYKYRWVKMAAWNVLCSTFFLLLSFQNYFKLDITCNDLILKRCLGIEKDGVYFWLL